MNGPVRLGIVRRRMSITIRPYEENDEDAILELFGASFGRPLSREYWRWRFQENPAGPPQIELAWDGRTLAGHYAVSPTLLELGQDRCRVALSMTTMTHPGYRGQDLFGRLASSLYARLADEGFSGVFGFPNSVSHRLFNRRLKWQDVGEISTLSVEVDAARLKDSTSVELRPLSLDDSLPEDLTSLEGGLVRMHRSADFYSWRLRTPERAYRPMRVMVHGAPAGVVVTKPFDTTSWDIVDLLIRPDDASAVISAVVSAARAEGVQRIHTWSSLWHPVRGALESAGFVPGGPVTMVGALWFVAPSAFDPFDARNWRLPMLASDVY